MRTEAPSSGPSSRLQSRPFTWTEKTFTKVSEAERLLCEDRDQLIQNESWATIKDSLPGDICKFILSNLHEAQILGFKTFFSLLNQKQAKECWRPGIEQYFKTTKYLEHLLSQLTAPHLAQYEVCSKHV